MKKRLLFILTIIGFFTITYFRLFAQEKAPSETMPTPTATPATLPEKIEISAEQFKTLQSLEQAYRLAALEAENLQLKINNTLSQIEKAQMQLKQLQEKATLKQQELQKKTAEAAEIPIDKLNQYQPEEKDGKLVLKRSKQ